LLFYLRLLLTQFEWLIWNEVAFADHPTVTVVHDVVSECSRHPQLRVSHTLAGDQVDKEVVSDRPTVAFGLYPKIGDDVPVPPTVRFVRKAGVLDLPPDTSELAGACDVQRDVGRIAAPKGVVVAVVCVEVTTSEQLRYG
jgi:hypothetical protein